MDQIPNWPERLSQLGVLSRELDALRAMPAVARSGIGYSRYRDMVRDAAARLKVCDAECEMVRREYRRLHRSLRRKAATE